MSTPTIPMPNDTFEQTEGRTGTVVASSWDNDDPQDGDFTAVILVLHEEKPFYSVLGITHDSDGWHETTFYAPGKFDTDEDGRSFLNIIPASRVYEDAIGGY